MPHTDYTYIIAGAGAAGLSLAWRLSSHIGKQKKVLLVDDSLKPTTSKTWCFWSKSPLGLKRYVHKSWNRLSIETPWSQITQNIHPYQYYAVQSAHFTGSILNFCRQHPQFDLIEGTIETIRGDKDAPTLVVNGNIYSGKWIFQSCFTQTDVAPSYQLGQHFIGWDIKTTEPVFDASTPIFMDFDGSYNGKGTAFMYMLPWTSRKALFEYTVFSADRLSPSYYEDKIIQYVAEKYGLNSGDFAISRKESGFIPMEDRLYKRWYASRVLSVGFSSGISKPSTGYTFKNIQHQARHIVNCLEKGRSPTPLPLSKSRYKIYDLLLLHILWSESAQQCMEVFHALFGKNDLHFIFRFLDEETIFRDELSVMASVPSLPFLKAIWKNRKAIYRHLFV